MKIKKILLEVREGNGDKEVEDDVFGFTKAINTDVLDKMSEEELKQLEEITRKMARLELKK